MKKPSSIDDQLSLREGLNQFYASYHEQLSHTDRNLPAEVLSFFKSHDIAHVLFACDISLYGEGAVKIWTIFGTSLGFWKHLTEYKKADAFELSKNFKFSKAIKDLGRLLIHIPWIIFRAKRMSKQWPWKDFEAHLDQPIHEIRTQFNIKPLH